MPSSRDHNASLIRADGIDPAAPAQKGPVHLGYRPAFDGLRGVSVLAVMLYHSGLLEGGWLGVDVFFALSGFLITTLLLEEHERAGAVSLRRFYARRALRLLPALLVMVAVVGFVMVASKPPELFNLLIVFVLAVVLYVANWAMIVGLPLYALAHTWSLAIEEQFYFFWPPVLTLLLRLTRKRRVILLVVGSGIVGAIAWRMFLMSGGTSIPRLFLGLDTRADSVLTGCALAMIVTWRMLPGSVLGGATTTWVGGAAAVAICVLFAIARFPADFRNRFATTLTALAAGLLICSLLSAPNSRIARLLEARPLVGVGKVSYGLYLWHFPIFLGLGVLLGRTKTFDPLLLSLAWLASFAVSIASYRFLEQPALRLKLRLAGASGTPHRR